jgi:hypothetical protein
MCGRGRLTEQATKAGNVRNSKELPLQEFVPGDFEDSDSFAGNNSSGHVFCLQRRKKREQIEESGNSQVTSMWSQMAQTLKDT